MREKSLMLVLFIALAVFAGLAFSAQAQDLTNTARIRVFKEADITLYPGEYCYGSDSPAAIHNSSGWLSIFSSSRLGMPLTEDITSAFNEYVIEAGKPLTVMLHWEAERDGVKATCGPIGSTFYPQMGKDYDVTIGYAGNCFLQIRELFEISPGKAETRQVPAGSSFACLNR